MQIELFKDLAIIILFAKMFGLLAKKLKAPQVVGEIVAGLIIGPSILGFVEQSENLFRILPCVSAYIHLCKLHVHSAKRASLLFYEYLPFK